MICKVPILASAFSLNMLPERPSTSLLVRRLNRDEVRALLLDGFESAVGHEAIAQVLAQDLEMAVEKYRRNIELTEQQVLLVAQGNWPRLQEGELLNAEQIEAAGICYFRVTLCSE